MMVGCVVTLSAIISQELQTGSSRMRQSEKRIKVMGAKGCGDESNRGANFRDGY